MSALTLPSSNAGRWCGLGLVLLLGCGGDGSTSPEGDAGTGSGDGGAASDGGNAGRDASSSGDASHAGTDGDMGSTDSGMKDGGPGERPEYVVPELEGRVVISHYLGDYDLMVFDTQSLELLRERTMPGPTGDVLPIPELGVLAVTYEGTESTQIEVLDSTTLEPIEGSPYTTATAPITLAHDAHLDRLYVYCIGTIGNPEESLLTVYDTSSTPWQEVEGSPLGIDVPAHEMKLDPVTGNLYGISIGTVWGVRVGPGGVEHLPSSPVELDQTGSDLALDPGRRRLYYTERRIPGDQHLYARNLDEFSEVQGSPVGFEGGFAGDLAAHPETGDVFMVAAQAPALHSASPDPLEVRDTCGSSAGCTIAPTETGVALDHERDRLFLVHLRNPDDPDGSPGFLTAWDVSDPAAPEEITATGSRPDTALYPLRAEVF